MRRTILYSFVSAPLALITGAFLIPPSISNSHISRYLPSSLQQSSLSPALLRNPKDQSPIMSPVLPGSGDNNRSPPSTSDDAASDLTISDILPLSRSINIFAQLTRDIASVTTRLSTSTPASNTTLLAPLNSAMQDLPRKPWEDRPGDTTGVSAQRDEQKAAENLRRFVEMHIVPVSPWVEGEDGRVETLGGGGDVWWEWRKDGDKRVRVIKGKGFELEVSEVVGKVGNGEIWAVKGVVNYE